MSTQAIPTSAPQTLTLDQRRTELQRVLASDTGSGWRVVTQTDTSAQLEKGKNTNHVLHLILSIITLGFWIPVWICVTIFSGRKSRYVQVDEYGNVKRS